MVTFFGIRLFMIIRPGQDPAIRLTTVNILISVIMHLEFLDFTLHAVGIQIFCNFKELSL
jgi:hypothetical protein